MFMETLIIGGGIVGIGIARDLALRGFDVTLVERGEIANETSTYFHGECHSGARYAVKDPEAAKKCIQENKILKDIAGEYIEDTGGLFLKLDEDTEEYFQEKKEMCEECGIETKVVHGDELREKHGVLSEKVDKALWAPDGVFKPIELMQATIEDAENHGAEFITNTEVEDIVTEDGEVVAVETEDETFNPDFVVNSTGPWAEKVSNLADIQVDMKPTKGVMTVLDNPGLDIVLNRCAPVDDGDIVIPKEDTVIVGTTSIEVEDPDDFPKNQEEEDLMLERGGKMIDGVNEDNLVSSYWGLRPLYDPSSDDAHERDVTREFTLIDHTERDDVDGMITVVGGKWTTHRFMAERAANKVCEKTGVDAECETADKELPKPSEVDAIDREWPPR